jgi:hypothetical protein
VPDLRTPRNLGSLQAWSLASLALLTVACGGGGGSTGGPDESLQAASSLDAQSIDHLLLRTQFGVHPTAQAAATSQGLPAYIDAMLEFPTSGTTAVETEAFQYLVTGTEPAGLEGKFPSTSGITDWWLHLMLHNPHPFQERLAMFWHDHFAVAYPLLRPEERYLMVEHIQKLRRLGIGNFRTLVLEMARDGAMLEWLDGARNVKGEPNENFAREFFELFTVGADRGYTETDIQEAARAFTGYRNRLDPATGLRYLEFDHTRKDLGAKVLFGNVVLFSNGMASDDFELVVDATFTHLDVASWLAEKLLLEFVTDTPGAALVANLAREVRRHDYEMRPILRTLFRSEAFHRRPKSMVRMPLEYAVGLIRSTGLMVTPAVLRTRLQSMAQVPGNPPSVFGWPQGSEWLAAAAMVERANTARRLIIERTFQTNNNHNLHLPVGDRSAAAVVDHLARLMSIRLDAAERDTLITYLNSNVLSNGTVQPSTFDASNATHVSSRARGLVYILANHPDAMRR